MPEPTYGVPEPYEGEGNELVNILDGERQEIAHVLGTEHPLFTLVDGAMKSMDLDELRVARAACGAGYGDPSARDGIRARQEVTRYNDEVHKLARRST